MDENKNNRITNTLGSLYWKFGTKWESYIIFLADALHQGMVFNE
jgi:hypothetical protein